MSLRLVVTTPFLQTRGGMERVVLKIAQHFDAKIYCVDYDSANTFPEFMNLDVEVALPNFLDKLPAGTRLIGAVTAGKHFYNIKLKDYDIINAHQTPSEWVRNKNSPVIWFCHSPNREAFDLYRWRMQRRNLLSKVAFWASIQAFKFFEFRVVSKIEYIFTNCLNTQTRIKKYLKRESEILYPAIDVEKFRSKDSEHFFFYPSRIVPEKDFEYAIEAFKLFSRHNPDWRLIIAGGLSKRPEHQSYFKKLKALSPESVSFEVNISEERLIDLYARCSAVIYTPINEDFGLVPLEAMASLKLCIAKNEGGPIETIENGIDGFLINSVQEAAEKMEWIAKNPERAKEIGKKGKGKVEKNFTWSVFLRRFEQKAKEMVENKNSSK